MYIKIIDQNTKSRALIGGDRSGTNTKLQGNRNKIMYIKIIDQNTKSRALIGGDRSGTNKKLQGNRNKIMYIKISVWENYTKKY